MSHFCICPKCNVRFDRDKELAVQVSARRYGHASCYPDNKNFMPLVYKLEDEEDYKKLMDYIDKLFNKKANYAMVRKQINQYVNENKYSLSGILKSLIWFYEIKGNSIEQARGSIGIVPFVYQNARDYYYSLFIAQSQNANKDVSKITSKVKEITIPLPQIKVPIRLFKMDDEVDNDELH